MTVSELLTKGRELLADIENGANEARWIFEEVFECSRDYFVFHANETADESLAQKYLSMIEQRASGMPVQ